MGHGCGYCAVSSKTLWCWCCWWRLEIILKAVSGCGGSFGDGVGRQNWVVGIRGHVREGEHPENVVEKKEMNTFCVVDGDMEEVRLMRVRKLSLADEEIGKGKYDQREEVQRDEDIEIVDIRI